MEYFLPLISFPVLNDLITSVHLSFSNPTGIVGSNIGLTCTTMLSLDVTGAPIEFLFELDGDRVAGAASNTQTGMATLSPLAISSAGNYTCIVIVVADLCEGEICPSRTSDPVTLRVQCEL